MDSDIQSKRETAQSIAH